MYFYLLVCHVFFIKAAYRPTSVVFPSDCAVFFFIGCVVGLLIVK